MHIVLKSAAFAVGSLALAAAAAAQPAPQSGAKAPAPQAKKAPPRRSGFAPRPKPANQPAITASLGPASSFTGVIDPMKHQLCYMLDAPAVQHPTGAHIDMGKAGKMGKAVVTLQTPADGSAGACQAIPADVAMALAKNPRAYSIDVDTAAFPHGAVTAQLTGAHQMSAG